MTSTPDGFSRSTSAPPSPPASGQHGYRLTADGLDVFPRLADTRDDSTHTMDPERVSTGIPLLDEMLGDGYWPGSTTP